MLTGEHLTLREGYPVVTESFAKHLYFGREGDRVVIDRPPTEFPNTLGLRHIPAIYPHRGVPG